MSFSRTVLKTALLLFATVALYAQVSFAEAADIEALNAFPTNGTSFYTTDTITFLGTVHNLLNEVVPEAGYADIEIDWNSVGGPDVSENANPDNSENRMGQLSQNGIKQLQEVVSNPPLGTHRYRFIVDTADDLPLEADETNNFSSWVSFTVVPVPVAPVITFSATPNPLTIGNSATLTWTVTDATSCTGSNGSAGWPGAKDANGGSQSVSPVVTTLYTISCTGPGGTASKGFTIDAVSPAPTITLTASVNPINAGGSTLLTWSTTNADTCTASGGWSGAKALASNQSVSPTTTTLYTLSCIGSGGTTTVSQSVTVNQTLPVITISASPVFMPSGGTTTITWSVTNATYCIGSNGGGVLWDSSKNPVGASLVVTSLVSRDWILNCSNPTAGTSTNRVTVWVTGLPNLITPIWDNGQRINTSIGSTTSILIAGQPNTLRAQVRNIGSSTTAIGFENRFSTSWGWNQGLIIGYTTSGVLGVNQTNMPYDEIAWTPTRAGHTELAFCADLPSSTTTPKVTEQNESDNCAYRQVSVEGTASYPTLAFTVPGGSVNSSSSMSTTTKLGATTTLSWNVSGAMSCTGSSSPNADPRWNGAKNASGSNTFDVNPVITAINGFNNYALTCTGPGGEVITKAIRLNVVTVQPTVTLSALSTSILKGSATALTWTATDSNTCVATSTPSDPNWTGSVSKNGSSRSTSNLNVSTNYKITCDSPSGTTIKNIQVDVKDPPPVISFMANSNPITPDDTTDLIWTATGASSCTGTSNPPEPLWDGARNITGGTITVAPDVTTTYTLTCASLDGLSSVPAPFTVSVAETAPLIDFSLNDTIIIENKDSAIFTWNIRGATSCTGVSVPPDADWDTVDFSANGYKGTKTVSPSVTTTYSVNCNGRWGTTEGPKAKIDVIPEATITEFQVCVAGTKGTASEKCASSPGSTLEDVDPGTPLEVFWDSVDATSCSAISGYKFSTGDDPTDGEDTATTTPYADSTDTYTIACGSLGYITSDSFSIHVHTNKKTPAIWITPKIVESGGGKVDVRWDTNNGDQTVCSIKGGGLTYNKNLKDKAGETGSALDVYILGRTSFVITCPSKVVDNNGASAGGTESATTTVELSPRIWGR